MQSVIGWPLITLLVLLSMPVQAQETGDGPVGERIGTIEYPADVIASRGRDEGLVQVRIEFTAAPTDVDLTAARVFAEPLIPIGEQVIEGENAALAEALKAHVTRTSKEDVSALDNFLKSYPNSRWRVGVQTNLAILRRTAGYFTEALARLEDAWALGKSAETFEGRALANRALGELTDLNAKFGRYERMKELFDETDERDIPGSAQTLISGAKEGYWRMTEQPADGFRCGLYAVNAVMYAGKKYVAEPEIIKEASTSKGTNLLQLKELSARLGQSLMPAQRSGEAAWAVPMVIHWKVGHFAAITRKENGKYLVQDPTFGGEIWVSAKALDTEATGYGLVLSEGGSLPTGWTALSDEAAAEVWGKGGATNAHPLATGPVNTKVPPCPPTPGMAAYKVFKMQATLQLWDNPMGYAPPAGPGINFVTAYNHRESGQPGNFSFMNFGAFWVCNWVSYALVEVVGGKSQVTVTLRGGGGEAYLESERDPLNNRYKRSLYSGAQLIKKGESRYERETPDGTREVYSQVDGTTGRIFLKEVIDPQGNKVVLNYNVNLRLSSIVDAIGQNTVITYKSETLGNAGYYKVHRATDPFGRYTEFTYDVGLTRLEKIRDVIGIESSFVYGDDGFITRLTTPYGNTDFYQYVAAPIVNAFSTDHGRGLLVILPDGSKECLESYQGHTLTTYYWDRKAMAMAPGDRTKAEQTGWMLDISNHYMMDVPRWTKKALEGLVTYRYADQTDTQFANGQLGSVGLPSKISRTLDDSSEQLYQYEYNDLGRVTKAVQPSPNNRTFSYFYAANKLDLMEVRQTRGGNNELLAKFTYDAKHNPLTATNASGRKTIYTYNSRGQVTTVTNPKSEVTTATYDGSGYLTQLDGPLSGNSDRTQATYDSYGRIQTVTSVQGPTSGTDHYTLAYSYDALDRLTQVDYPDGTNEKNVYSRLDLLRSKDRLGRWTQNTYNALGELTTQRDPQGRITLYEWCRCGALQKLTDAMGRVTNWTYDVQGRLTRKTYADSSYEAYAYEMNISRLDYITDPAGNVKDFSYNVDNTLAGITYTPVSSDYADVADVSVAWDPSYPRVTSVSDSYGTYGYSYNAFATDSYGGASNGRGRISGISNSALANAALSFEYDELGRQTKRQINGGANESAWSFDAAGRVSSWTNPLGTFTPAYVNAAYGVARPASVSFPNGQTVNYQWEDKTGDFRLKQIENLGASSTALSKFDYVTDAVSRITQWKQQKGTAATERFDLGYDAVDQLTSAVLKTDSTSAILKQNYYKYDAAGNRNSEQIDSTVKSATFNNLNQLTATGAGGSTRFKGKLGEPGTATVGGQAAWMTTGTNFQVDVTLATGTNTVAVIAKDVNNNSRTNSYQVVIPSGGSTTVTYDANGNQLSDGTNTYAWDAVNRLVKTTYASGARTEYSYDAYGNRVKIVEKNSGGTVTSTKQFVFDGMEEAEQRDGGNTVTKRYYPDGWRDVTGSASYFYTKDHLGSVREVTNGSGSMVARYDYDPYGRTTKVSGSVDSDMLYTGHYFDLSSGLYLTAYRAYTPNLARWLSRDPMGESDGPNVYSYVHGNPINMVDPDGLAAIYTDQTSGVTYFNPNPEMLGPIHSWPSRSDVVPSSKDGAAGPYESANVYPAEGPRHNNPRAYGPNDLLLTDDPRGRWLHGGGSGLPNPLAPLQGWYPTHGCTRMQNQDIQDLVDKVRDFKRNNPGVKIPYSRSRPPLGDFGRGFGSGFANLS